MGSSQSQPEREYENEKGYRYYLFNTGVSGRANGTIWTLSYGPFVPDAPVRKPQDMLCMIDLKAKNIREILVVCGGVHIMRFSYPEGTDVIENLDILGVHTEIPRFLMEYHDFYLVIKADSEPDIKEYVREPTESDRAIKNWSVLLPECPENFQQIYKMILRDGMSGFFFNPPPESQPQ